MDDEETASGVVALNEDNDDEDELRFSSPERVSKDEAFDERWARYFDGWNERMGKRTGREDFIQRLFDSWKRLMWKI